MAGRDGANVRLVDNPDTWLAFTDLVLIDPVGTGWSRAAKPDGASAFWGVRRDAESMAKVIALYVAKNGRGSSPKYILGESYGGFRAAKVAGDLQKRPGHSGDRHPHGVADARRRVPVRRRPVRARRRAAIAVARRRRARAQRARSARRRWREAEHFALTDYLTTLAGPPPQGDAAKAFYARVAQITGLPEDVVARSRGFIRDAYVKNLRAAEHKIVSHYDATFAVDDPNPGTGQARAGPTRCSMASSRAYGGAFVGYARDELGFKTEMTYNLLASEISGKWDWDDGGRAPPSAAEDLRELLALTPSFRLMIAHGYSDMVTPYAGSRYVLDHLPPIGGGRARRAQALSRRPHVLYRSAVAQRFHRRRPHDVPAAMRTLRGRPGATPPTTGSFRCARATFSRR